MTRGKSLVFHLLILLASLLIALVAVELVLRTMAFSTGDGGGRAAIRWDKQHWKPVNQEGFRDFEWQPPGGLPALVFLGDSFTDGHGVDFEQTYYFLTRTALAGRYAAYNVGRSGASTRMERANYHEFRQRTGIRPAYVVFQYFGNDMQELLPPPPEWKPWPGLAWLSQRSDLAELVWTYMDGVRWGRLYADHFLSGYANPSAYAAHRADLEGLLDEFHHDGAKLVFVVFPYLDNEEFLDKSRAAYVERMRSLFQSRCLPGDVFLDASPLALEIPLDQRTVNRLDGHPSPRLHARIAGLLVGLLQGPPPPAQAALQRCTRTQGGVPPGG